VTALPKGEPSLPLPLAAAPRVRRDRPRQALPEIKVLLPTFLSKNAGPFIQEKAAPV